MDRKGSLAHQIGSRADGHKITVLGIMVFGGPFAEATETRIRQRYAALSGLRRLGFVPEDPEHIDYIKVATHTYPESDAPTLATIMPFEWLTNTGKDSVLLLWLNVDLFMNEPLARLARLMKCLKTSEELKDTGRISLKVIGPPGSTALQVMLKETETGDPIFEPPESIEIYSAMATVDDRLLLESIGEDTDGMTPERAHHEIKERFRKHRVTFKRTIVSDWELTKLIIRELGLRRVDLKAPGNHVVLVAEWDTDYGRSLPETFSRVLTEEEERVPVAEVSRRVHRVSYLRGIDGSLPGDKRDKKDDQSDTKANPEDKIRNLEQPSGSSQFDYLRRTAHEIYLLNEHLRENGEGIKAIGILGTDLYDKHLVLQAFRQRLPEAIFFTTDLDAWLLHPINMEWTRNLIVASSFDLSLRKDKKIDLQGDIPPFRESYQTSLFFAILRAFQRDNYLTNDETTTLKQPVLPLIFEIGWNGAYNLTDLTDESVQPRREESQKNRMLFRRLMWLAIAWRSLLFLTRRHSL